jgi:protein involved in polysaccharide export with SLBB domain
MERRITVGGAVRRSGTYELLPGEHLLDLIEVYGDGLIPLADQSRIELTRFVNSDSISGDKTLLGEDAISNNYALENYDVITIPSIMELLPVFFVEGAVGIRASEEDSPTSSSRLVVSFHKGDFYASIVRSHRNNWFSAVSDTQNAYILRKGKQISINLNRMLYDADFREETLIEENDTLVIPFRQYFVTVAGAVKNPGRYPYIPDREWDYYIGLAGGFSPGMNNFDAITIQDISGKRMKKVDVITPETIITAKTNHFLYYFNQFGPVVTTLLSVVTAFITVTMLLNQ